MKVYTVTSDFFPSVRELFSKHGDTELLPTNYRNIPDFSADVIVFTGGEDINPERYKESGRNGYYNDHRDTWELKVFKDILSGKLKTKKVLGICRGMQLINVGLGGTLFYDIFERFHASHEPTHELRHTIPNNALSFLQRVNSLHHQGLCVLGSTPKSNYKVLAVEPNTKVPEIVIWGEGMLGVQFHPEFFSNENENKWKFADTIKNWTVDNEKILIEQPSRQPKRGTVDYNYYPPLEPIRTEDSEPFAPTIPLPSDEQIQEAINALGRRGTMRWATVSTANTTEEGDN